MQTDSLDALGGTSASKNRRVRRIGFLGPPVRSIVKDDEELDDEDQENVRAPSDEALKRRERSDPEHSMEKSQASFSLGDYPCSSLSLAPSHMDTGLEMALNSPPVKLPSPPKSAAHESRPKDAFVRNQSGSLPQAGSGCPIRPDSAYATNSKQLPVALSSTVLSQSMSVSPTASSSDEQDFAEKNLHDQYSHKHSSASGVSTFTGYAPKKAVTPNVVSWKEYLPLFEPKIVLVNNRPYNRLDQIGRGGSSKVYKVITPQRKILALKRVGVRNADALALESYFNEIKLLQQLQSNPHIIKLYDWEQTADHIVLVMECGEIDLAHLLQRHQTQRLSMNFIRLYWEQMLQAVQAIHDAKIVHTDLKPANFLLVEGSVKLIDFGIAKAIGNDTTNIQRECPTGTCNYMSPESLSFVEGKQGNKTLKLGRASDVWSLGCILYQMVYGQPPFAELSMLAKLQAIVNEQFQIPFPELSASRPVPSADCAPPASGVVDPVLLQVLKRCLDRNPLSRMTIPSLLEHPFLYPEKAYRVPSPPPPLPQMKASQPLPSAPQPIRKFAKNSSSQAASHSFQSHSNISSNRNSNKLHQKPFKPV